MQPIQDKDFDKLFKDAFEDAEIKPSRDLWSNIESEIEPKKKRIIPIYWLSAAAVLLIATVGILLYHQQDVKPKQFANRIEKKVIKPIIEVQPIRDSAKTAEDFKEKTLLPTSLKPIENVAKTTVTEKINPPEKQKVFTAPEMQKQETTLAKVDEPKKDIKTKIEEAIQPKEEMVIAMVEVPKTDVVEDQEQSGKGIRNVGDVVNLIVNKVDKRKDKFIQFRTDDDDSSLSSINIGPFKIGKKNRNK